MINLKSRWLVSAASAVVLAGLTGGVSTAMAQQVPAGSPYNGTPLPMPGHFEAEAFDTGGEGVAYHDNNTRNVGGAYRSNEGVDIVASSDPAGGNFVVYHFQTNEWLSYTVDAAETARYDIELRVASAMTGSAFRIEVDGEDVSGRVVIPNTGEWNSFTWVSVPSVILPAGTHKLAIVSEQQYFNLNSVRSTSTPVAAPFAGKPFAVPGTFEAEDFNLGGEGISYHDNSAANVGGQYRSNEAVDIIATSDASGGAFEVNNFETGEWLNYTIDVASAGDYDIDLRVASAFTTGAFHIEIDGENVSGSINVPNTGGWNVFEAVRAAGIPLAAGQHVLTVVADNQYFNFNNASITKAEQDTPTSEPFGGSPAAVPAYIEAEHFDLGGQGLAYNELSAGNLGGAYRADEDVDIAPTSDPAGGNFDINYFETGEWLNYTIDVPQNGDYNIALRAASAFANSAFHIEIDGRDVTGRVAVPNTGSWSAFQWVGRNDIALTKGTHVMRIVADTQYFNLNSIQVTDASAPPPDSGAKLIFRSGFDGATSLVPLSDCWGTGCWQDIVGLDNLSNFNWPSSFWNGTSRFLMLSDPVWTTPASMSNYMFNRIENGSGPKGTQSRLLYQQITKNANGTEPMGTSPAQNELQFLPTTELGDLYVSFWIKLQPDLVEKMTNLPPGPGINNGGTWRAFFALKTGTQKPDGGPSNDGDYRVETYIMTYGGSQPYWAILGDNNAGGGAPNVNSWNVENRQVPVPVGRWFKFEIFWHRSSGNDGRVWMAADGKVIADRFGPNMGAWNMPINRIMAPMLYSGSRMPIYQWVDDLEIWDGFPSASGNNQPYAAH